VQGRLRPPLDLLGVILPGEATTSFLVACLAPPPLALEAWQRWRAVQSPVEGLAGANAGLRGLAAVLATSLFAAGAPLNRSDAAWLRAALLHEQRRSVRYREILAEVLATLHAGAVPFLLARGAAVAETILPEPWLRHCHDVDLLVAEEHLDAAAAALTGAGLREQADQGPSRCFLHRRLLPIRLHPRTLKPPFEGPCIGLLDARATPLTVLGTSVRRPADDDLLLHLCAHSACSQGRSTLRWISDAHAIVRSRPDLDWHRLRQTAAATGLAAQVAATLGYLASRIGTPVPADTLAALTGDASRATRLERDLLIHAARLGRPSWLADLWRTAGGRSRLTLARWILAPDPSYLARLDGGRPRTAAQLLVRHWRRGWQALPAATRPGVGLQPPRLKAKAP
jgi:hypothetical protein